MSSLFRYLSLEHAEALVHRGEVLFRSLSYFRDYEDNGVRADPDEGTLVHRPKAGLTVRVERIGQEITVPYTFESTAREDDIFIYCVSTRKSASIASRFSASACVEILDGPEFVLRIRAALDRSPGVHAGRLLHEPVRYYEHHEPPIVDWALPERIALRKPSSFSWQHEYRLAFEVNGAFTVEDVQVRLVPLGPRIVDRASSHPQVLLKVGDMSDLCRIHAL